MFVYVCVSSYATMELCCTWYVVAFSYTRVHVCVCMCVCVCVCIICDKCCFATSCSPGMPVWGQCVHVYACVCEYVTMELTCDYYFVLPLNTLMRQIECIHVCVCTCVRVRVCVCVCVCMCVCVCVCEYVTMDFTCDYYFVLPLNTFLRQIECIRVCVCTCVRVCVCGCMCMCVRFISPFPPHPSSLYLSCFCSLTRSLSRSNALFL